MKKITSDMFFIFIIGLVFFSLTFLNFYKSSGNIADKIKTLNMENASEVLNEINEEHRNNFLMKDNFADIYGVVLNLLDNKIVGNFEFVKDENNFIHRFEKSRGEEALNKFSSEVIKLKHMADEKNIPLTYVQMPARIFKNDISGLDILTEQVKNDDMDKVIAKLKNENIDIIDFRDVIENEYQKEDVFMSTDVHMKTETEFWIMRYLANYLNDKCGMKYENGAEEFELDNYTLIERDLLGNFARSSGKYFAGLDKFSMYIPNFYTNYTVEDYASGDVKYGSFQDAVMNGHEKNEDSDEYTYWVINYLRYPSPYYSITNNNVSDNKILVIMNSHALRVMSYLSLLTNNITVIDSRFQGDNDYVRKAIAENDFDTVLVIHDIDLADSNLFKNIIEKPSAEIISTDMPTEIERGESYDVHITVKNTTEQAWSEADMIRLCIWQDGQDFGFRVNIPDGIEIKPNEEYTFTLNDFVAPPNNSTYVEFQMLQEGVAYFGEKMRVDVVVK